MEDEAEMAAAPTSALKGYDMVVDHVPTFAEAEEAISADVHSAVLLDRQLPDGDGLALIPKLRARADGVPIIVLTARGDLADRITGLDSGADDYLAKPFAVEELLARLRAVLRRPANVQLDIIRAGRVAFDLQPSRGQRRRPPARPAAARAPGAGDAAAAHRTHGAARRAGGSRLQFRRRDPVERARHSRLACQAQARRHRCRRRDPQHPRRRLSPEADLMSETADQPCLRSCLSWRLVALQAVLLVTLIVLLIAALRRPAC